MFLEHHIDIGAVRVGSQKEVFFPYDNTLDYIKRIEISCDCTRAYNDVKNKRLVATFTAKEIPKHLISQGWYKKTLTITVMYVLKQEINDGTESVRQETTQFTVKIVK